MDLVFICPMEITEFHSQACPVALLDIKEVSHYRQAFRKIRSD